MTKKPEKPYYNHDLIWSKRAAAQQAYWGPYSVKVYAEVMDLLLRYAPPPAWILDAGCGAGAFGTKLVAKGYEYVGVDESAAAIALGQKVFLPAQARGYELMQLDLAKPLPAALAARWQGQFAAVTCINVLHCLVEA